MLVPSHRAQVLFCSACHSRMCLLGRHADTSKLRSVCAQSVLLKEETWADKDLGVECAWQAIAGGSRGMLW